MMFEVSTSRICLTTGWRRAQATTPSMYSGGSVGASKPEGHGNRRKLYAILVAIAFVLAVVVSSYAVYNYGYSNGYNAGVINGEVIGQEEQLVQVGAMMTLSPGSTISMQPPQSAFNPEKNFTVYSFVQFTVYCQGVAPCPSKQTVELYVQSYPQVFFNTTYVQNYSNPGEAFKLTIPWAKDPVFILKASPQNTENVVVFWNTPLALYVRPYPIPPSN